jgi:hypothetical protein
MTKARLAAVKMESKGMIITYKSSFNWHLILGSERNSLIFMIGQAALPYMVQILAPEWRFWRREQLRTVSMTDSEARKCNLCE